ncbi:hypothetical protein ACG0Z6_05805 [Roseateles sp. BYS180W]|uniref:Uncharacterized protein n=1 Tax=Roseateles rivi TaxID=3299028 RepID=A0ABW7FTW8_9BURK
MTADSIITILGAIITVAGARFTISEARKAKNYSEQIKVDVEKVSLMRITESFYRCQEEVRKLPRDQTKIPRGFKIADALDRIWPHFDQILSSHVLSGDNTSIRQIVIEAQGLLRKYETNSTQPAIDPYNVQCLIQQALSEINSKLFKLDGKA